MTEVDVLVVGGGPAGLLAASQLAPQWKVALIESGVVGRTTKYWVTSERRLRMHALTANILYRPPAVVVGSFLGGNIRAAGDFAVVNDETLLAELSARCRRQNVQITESCSLLNFRRTQTAIEAQTTEGRFHARLLVDATGGLSPVAKTFRLHRIDGFYAVYGALLRNIDLNCHDIVLAHVDHLGDPPPILEVIPCSQNSAYCAIFTYSRLLSKPEALEASFNTYCRHNDFFRITARTEFGEAKLGAIPIGRMSRRRLRGIAAVGEAAMIQPPLLGTAFNEALEYSGRIAAHFSDQLRKTSGTPSAPHFKYPLLKRVQDRLQLEMARFLLRGNVETFDKLVQLMSVLPEKAVYNLCSNDLTWPQLLVAAVQVPPYLFLPKGRSSERV